MKTTDRLIIILACLFLTIASHFIFQHLVLPDLTYHHQWQVRGQEERVGFAVLKKRYTTGPSRNTYYTYHLEGKGDAPSLKKEEDILLFGTDSSLMDNEKVWNVLLKIDTLSEISIKWTIAKNGNSVFTEINQKRDIGGTTLGFSAVLGAFIMSSITAIILFISLVLSFFKWIKNR